MKCGSQWALGALANERSLVNKRPHVIKFRNFQNVFYGRDAYFEQSSGQGSRSRQSPPIRTVVSYKIID
jgi:hypothetical protein